MIGIVDLSEHDFDKEVLQSKELVLVDFWAPWCAPCQIIAPIISAIAKEYTAQLKICKINVDDNQALAAKFQVLSIPTLLFFKEGRVINQITGARSSAEIKKTIDSLLPSQAKGS